MRILLIEDDPMIGDSICKVLKLAHFAVDWMQDGSSAEYALARQNHALLLLDIGLPRKNGLEILKSLRKNSNSIPVLILTARDSVEDRILGLDNGADDYLVKPFDLDELLARMRALLRRNSRTVESAITHGEIALDALRHEVKIKGAPVYLPVKEFAILHALMEQPGCIISRDKLEERIYGWDDDVGSNTIEVYIYNLRKKFGADIIRNIRGVGYKLGNPA